MYPSSEKSVPKISSSWALEGTISNKHSLLYRAVYKLWSTEA